jgi:aminoglycoside/choline kinase family phosphotransferase
VEMDGQIQIDEDYLEANAHCDEMESESEQFIELEELKQYRENLLEWCNNLFFNWNKSKKRLSSFVDYEILEEWEGMYSPLKEKLQEDRPLDYKDYESANTLYEQWKNLLNESYSYQNEIEVG